MNLFDEILFIYHAYILGTDTRRQAGKVEEPISVTTFTTSLSRNIAKPVYTTSASKQYTSLGRITMLERWGR